jgi:putative endonuclease
MQKHYFVYIMTNKMYGTLYVGITNDLLRRVFEHKEGKTKGFTSKYHLDKLIYYDESSDVNAAIRREKQLKGWNRQWKINLIEEFNPNWNDLSQRLLNGA